MKDILFIGGPEAVQGVDRIGDDLLSILSAEHLYDRKSVVVWPTEKFLSRPDDSTKLLSLCHEQLAELIAIDEKKLIPFGGVSTDRYRELVAKVQKDSEAISAARDVCVRSQGYAALSRLMLAVPGGQNLVVVVDSSVTTKAVSWLTFPKHISHGQGKAVKAYKSSDSGYGALNAVKDWPSVFDGPTPGLVKVGDLVPTETFTFNGEKIFYDPNSYMGVDTALTADLEVSYPVTDRFGAPRSIKISGVKGYFLLITEPDKLRNFVIGLKTIPTVRPEAGETTPAPSKVDTNQYLTRKQVAELLEISERSVDRYITDGKLKSIKVGGNVRITKASVDELTDGE